MEARRAQLGLGRRGRQGQGKVEKSGGDEAKGGSDKAKPESKEVVEPQ